MKSVKHIVAKMELERRRFEKKQAKKNRKQRREGESNG